MDKISYLNYLLKTLMEDMRVPMGVRDLADVAIPIPAPLKKGTYVWKLEPEFHNTLAYRVRLNHAESGAAGGFKFVAFDDKLTPGRPSWRSESALMTGNPGETSEWVFNNYYETVFVGIEVAVNTPILLTTQALPGFRGLNPFWLTGPVQARGNQLRPGTLGDIAPVVPFWPSPDYGERYPALQIAPANVSPLHLTSYYHVDFEQPDDTRRGLEHFCADLLQHFLDHYHLGSIVYDKRAQWRQRNPRGSEREYLDYLLLRLTQQPLNFPDPATLPERLTRRFRTNFVAPELFEGSGVDFLIEILQRDLAGRNVPFQTAQQWGSLDLRRDFPENFAPLYVPLQRASAAGAIEVELLRSQISAARPKLPQWHGIQLILEVLDRALELDQLLAEAWTALTRNETGIAEAALMRAEGHTKFIFHHNYELKSEMTTSEWAQRLAGEDQGDSNDPPTSRALPDHVRFLVREDRGPSLLNIRELLRPGFGVVEIALPTPMYAQRTMRLAGQIDELAGDIRFVPPAKVLGQVIEELLEKSGNYTQLGPENKLTLEDTIVGLWNLVPHYVHFQLPLALAELHRRGARHEAARHFLAVVLDDGAAAPAAMVRYPFLNVAVELPAVALRSARNYRERGDQLLRSLDSESRVLAEDEYNRARRLLTLAVKQENPVAMMELAACAVGIDKIRRRLNVFGYGEDYVPLFRYQPMVMLAEELAQQALDAGRQLMAFWQQAEQAQRAELEASHAIALNGVMVEVEELRLDEARVMEAVTKLQVEQVAQQIADLDAKINELSDPVFFWAAVATGVQSSFGFMGAGAAIGGPVGALGGVILGAAVGASLASETGPGALAGAGLGATVGGAVGGLVGIGAGALAGGYLAYAQGAAQWKAHESNLNDQKRSKVLLERFGTRVAALQLEAARTQALIAERMAEIARLRLEQSRELATLLREQFFNAERFYQLAEQMREIYRTLLRHAMRAAFLAEQSLEFELNERINVIGYEYDQPGEQQLLGAERLRSDLATLRTQRVERFSAKRLPACISISLAEEFPLALFQMRATGKATIRTHLSFLDRLYPGAYQARISRIELLFFALTPQVGLHGTVKSSGVSFVKDEQGQEIALITPPETMLISRYQYRDGAFYFALPEEQLHPFEGSGVATDFTIELPSVANNFERSTIADVHVIVHFTALYSRALEAQVIAQRPKIGVTMRSFSLHNVFSDAFFDLMNQGACEFSLSARHFPRSHRDPKIRRTMLLTVLKPESKAETVRWQVNYTDRAGLSRSQNISVRRSNPGVEQPPQSMTLLGMSAFGKWNLKGSLTNTSGAPITLEQDLSDLLLFLEYEYQQ